MLQIFETTLRQSQKHTTKKLRYDYMHSKLNMITLHSKTKLLSIANTSTKHAWWITLPSHISSHTPNDTNWYNKDSHKTFPSTISSIAIAQQWFLACMHYHTHVPVHSLEAVAAEESHWQCSWMVHHSQPRMGLGVRPGADQSLFLAKMGIADH